jgi:hypothetical protein
MMPADLLALADIGLPGGRSGLALLHELACDDCVDAEMFGAAGLTDWMGAALDIGGLMLPCRGT